MDWEVAVERMALEMCCWCCKDPKDKEDDAGRREEEKSLVEGEKGFMLTQGPKLGNETQYQTEQAKPVPPTALTTTGH